MLVSLVARRRSATTGGAVDNRRSPPRLRVCDRNRTNRPIPVLSTRPTPPRSIMKRRNSRRPRLMDASSTPNSSPATMRPLHRITYSLPQWRASIDSDTKPSRQMHTVTPWTQSFENREIFTARFASEANHGGPGSSSVSGFFRCSARQLGLECETGLQTRASVRAVGALTSGERMRRKNHGPASD